MKMGKRKDARWQCAYNMAETLNLEYDDFSYTGWNKLLKAADEYLNEAPEMEDVLYEQWRESNG